MSKDDTAGLYDGFEEYAFPTDDEFEEAIRGGVVTLDANVLLNLYKLDAATRDKWLDLLEQLGTNHQSLWISHQAVKEFWNNRTTAAMFPEVATRAKDEIGKASAQIAKQFRFWSRTLSGGAQGADSSLEAVEQAIKNLAGPINDFIEKHQSEYSEIPSDDLIVQRLAPLLADRVGPAPSPSELTALNARGAIRFENKVPPGFLDNDKGTDKKYGDYILWTQVLTEGHRRGNGKLLPVLIVTADAKADWWRTAFGGGANIGPHLELIREARDEAGLKLLMLSPGDFLSLLGRQFDVEVDQRMIDSTSEAGADLVEQPYWTPAEVRLVVNRLLASPYPHLVKLLQAACVREDGFVAKADVADIVGFPIADFRRFSLPVRTQTSYAAAAGDVSEGLPDLLVGVFGSGGLAGYRIPSEDRIAVRDAFGSPADASIDIAVASPDVAPAVAE
jgi:hypothetical protein